MNGIWLWLFLLGLQFALALYVITKRRNTKAALGAVTISVLVPIVVVAFDCIEDRISEACVWGQALMPLYLGFALLAGAPFLYLMLSGLTGIYSKLKNNVR